MSKPFTMHVAGSFENMKQHCVMCGKVLCDYRKARWTGSVPPKGWPEGESVFQLDNITQTVEPDHHVNCINNDND